MSTDPEFLSPTMAALILAGFAFLTAVIGLLKYALSVWAIRTARSSAERKAQAEVAKKAVTSSTARGLFKLPGPRGKGAE